MNERIEKLLEQVQVNEQVRRLAEQAGCAIDRLGYGEGNLEKFAELIVKECEAKHFSEGYLCGKRDGRILAIHECSEYLRERGDISRSMDLKQHFGVEE